jgi:MEMO1 family protein
MLDGDQKRAGQVSEDLQGARTRPAAMAGLFYPRDPIRLQTEVLELLGGASPPSKVLPKALIAPHAGYVYSGRVAGAAFAKLRSSTQPIKRVVLIGPAHYVHLGGIAAPKVSAFETPLGRVIVDTEACSKIGRFEFVTRTDAPHGPEHSLEVELPFLQTVLPSFQVVPLVVGDAAPQEVAQLLRQLWHGPETLIVASSDLSHYHTYEAAQRLDLSTAEAIEQGEWASLDASRACGWVAVAGLLIEARRRGLGASRLALCNSGDTAGSRDRVVGYGAWMFGEAA